MSEAAVSIIREFIGRPDARLRENACVALSSVGGRDGLELLIATGTDDREESVRQCALRELQSLPDDQISLAQEIILQKLLLPSGTARTYCTAAALTIAKEVQFDIPLTTSLRYTWLVTAIEGKGAVLRYFWKTAALFCLGVLLGWLTIGSICGLSGTKPWTSEGYPDAAVIGIQLLAAVFFCVLASLRDIHWDAQANVIDASVLELGLTTVESLIAASGVVALFWLMTSNNAGRDWKALTIHLIFLLPVALIISRFVTLSLLSGKPKVIHSLILRIIAGWWSGTFVLLFASAFMKPETAATWYSSIFAAGVPLLLGATFVYAFRDRTYASRSAALGPAWRWAITVFIALSVIAMGFSVIRRHTEQPFVNRGELDVVGGSNRTDLGGVYGRNPVTVVVKANNTLISAQIDGAPYRLEMVGPNRSYEHDEGSSPRAQLLANAGDKVIISVTKDMVTDPISLLTWLQQVFPFRKASTPRPRASVVLELTLTEGQPK